jgi:2-keto-3-deoxy-L-rhamnonate aldolase RhmA
MTFRPRQNRILAALANGKVPIGMEMNTGNPSMIEILAYAGFDFYMLDMEHTRVNVETMEHCIRAADAAGITTIVRVPENNVTLIRHAQEAGAQGIMVPHVETAKDVRKALDALRYPPEGRCGICPSVRAANFANASFREYQEFSNQQTMFIPLIEDKSGVENAEEIFSLLKPGVDAVGPGMGDLAFSLITQPGQNVDWQNPYLTEAFDKVMALSKKTGVPIINMAHTPEGAKETIGKGTRILLYSIDQQLFYNLCLDIIRSMKE